MPTKSFSNYIEPIGGGGTKWFQHQRPFSVAMLAAETIQRLTFCYSERLPFGWYFLIGICQSKVNAINAFPRNV